ncbi:MAG: dihydroorotase [Bacteroides sp.]|nr:dihydroorotase [Roseburia sp.]MCM1345881.1 dihydroorotase [Bacteroides sp.]MCM1421233.1 dihydroorotase [Bacteroides sp.]
MRTIIKNATIVNEGRQFLGTIVIEDEWIVDVFENEASESYNCDNLIDASGMYVFPGVIDDHVHFREPGLTYKADIESESRTAAAGGVTSYMEMPNTVPQTTTLELLDEKFCLAAEKSRVNYSFFFGATNDNVSLLPQLDSSRVCGVKVFMGSSTGNMLVDNESALRQLFKTSPLLIMAHCEDTNVINRNIELFKKKYKGQNDFPVRYHSRIRSVEACYESSSLAVRLAKETGARLHIAHISTAKELSLFESKPLENKQITAEVCIAHLMFTTEDYDLLGTKIKCNPAIKTNEDREALREALTDGRLDIVATDHAPHLLNEKVGGALKAASGMPMIQFSLVSMLELSDKGVLPLERIPELMSHNPATLYRIKKRGYVRKGYYADLVVVDPNANWQVMEGRYYTKCGWTPMDERTFKWKVRRTIVNGRTVYCDGIVVDGVRGKELEFGC